jgi:hypothetical protein
VMTPVRRPWLARGSALGLTILLAGALSGCTILGGGARKPDPGTHMAPALYRHQLDVWCRPLERRAQRVVLALQRDEARHDRDATVADVSAFLRLYIARDAHLEATPVPAAMKARMAPALERMAETDPSVQSMLAAFRSRDYGQVVAGYQALRKLSKKTANALRDAGVACG